MSAAPLFTHSHPDLDIQRPFDAAVVIPTLVRVTLTRAVESIYAQDLDGSVQILIGIDDPKADFALLDRLVEDCPDHMALTIFNPGYSTFVSNGGLHSAYGGALPTMLSYLANSRHVAYLDDDNWWAPSHLSDLKGAIKDHAWAFSLRWFVDPDTEEKLCIDDWESVGPGGGNFKEQHDGFVDPNVLMIDKIACEPALRLWTHPMYPGGKGSDRTMFNYLKDHYPFNCTFHATAYYEIDPNDGLHELRMEGVARRRSRRQTDADFTRRLSHLPPLIQESSRKWLVRKLARSAIGALIGVRDGDFATRLLDATRPAELHLIDTWGDERYQQILTRFEGSIGEGQVQVHRQAALPAITNLPDDDLDWAYLEGGQPYEEVKQTLELLWRKVKNRGWIAGGGFGEGTGVQQAVDEFLAKGGVKLVKIAGDQFVLRKRPGGSPQPRNESLRTLRKPAVSEIRGKTWRKPASTVGPDDFWTHNRSLLSLDEAGARRDISLYCFDDPARQALFVEIPPEADRNDVSVYFRMQYENARKVISVPYESLPAYCGEQDAAPVFIFSIGRCAATLLCKVLGLASNAVSLSEPGIYSQVLGFRRAEYRKVGTKRDRELTELLRLGTHCLQKNMTSAARPKLVLKVRDRCIAISDLISAAVPRAKLIFLYRDPEEWARTSMHAPGHDGEEQARIWDEAGTFFQKLAESGAALHTLNYDTLRTDGINAISEAAQFCGVQPPPEDAARELLEGHFDAEGSAGAPRGDDGQLDIFRAHIGGASSPFES